MTKPLLPLNVGVDVGKAQLDLYLLERGQALTVSNDELAIASLVRRLRRYRLERIVIEATGRLEQPFDRRPSDPASLPSTATAASSEENAVSAAAVLTLVPRSISARWSPLASILTSNVSTNA